MNNQELKSVYGGINLSSAFLSALIKGVTTFYDIGRRVGSYIIRYKTNTMCSN